MSTGKRIVLSRRRAAVIALGMVLAVGATVAATVAVEHALHDHDEHEHDHAGHEHGEDEHAGEAHAEGRVELGPEALKNAELEILTAGPAKLSVTLALPGEIALNAEATAHVTPRVAGVAREVKRQVGETVKKGDVLAVLDSRELADMQRELLAAKERLTLAEANFERQEKLRAEGLSAEKDHLAAKQALAEARIEHRSAAQKVALAGQGAKGGGHALVAPLDGTILARHATVGEVLKEDAVAFVIADLSVVWVNVTVYARDLARVHVGQPVWVQPEGVSERAEGTISFVQPIVGEQTRSASARVVLQNAGGKLRPGLFVTAEVGVEQVDAALAISEQALQRLDGKDAVFVQEGDAFEARPVKLGRKGKAPDGSPVVEVLGGLAPGDRYVGKNSFLLKAELGKSEAGHEH